MDRLVLQRGVIRSKATRILNKATTALDEENTDVEVIQSLINRLEVEQENLNEANKALMDTLIDMDPSQEDIEMGITSVEEYDDKIAIGLSRLRAKAKKNVNPGSRPASPVASEYSTASGMGSSTSKKRHIDCLKLKLKLLTERF